METTLSHQKDALGQSGNQNQLEKRGDIFPRKNPTSGAWNGCGVCSSGVASQERWAVRIQGGERRGGRRPSHRHRQNRPQSATRPESRGARATRRGELGSDIFRVWAQPSPPLVTTIVTTKIQPPRTLIITLTMTATMTTSCPSL